MLLNEHSFRGTNNKKTNVLIKMQPKTMAIKMIKTFHNPNKMHKKAKYTNHTDKKKMATRELNNPKNITKIRESKKES